VALSSDLITTARQLAHLHQRRPRPVDLHRSISTSYFALFCVMAELAVGRLVGSTSADQRSTPWARFYQDLNHLMAQKACTRPELQSCSQKLARLLMAFPTLQEPRHQANYAPIVRFKQGEALSADAAAEHGLTRLQTASRDEQLDFITLALGMTRS